MTNETHRFTHTHTDTDQMDRIIALHMNLIQMVHILKRYEAKWLQTKWEFLVNNKITMRN